MVSNIPPGWVFIGLLFIGLLAWYFRELNSCEDNENAASEQKNKANNALTRKAIKAAHNSCKAWKNHIKDPKGQIELLTLLAILVYTGLTYSLMNATKTANGISRESFTAVQRAFVVVDDMTFEATTQPDRRGKNWWNIYPIIKNSGNTPTRNLTVFYVDSSYDVKVSENLYPHDINAHVEILQDPADIEDWLKSADGNESLARHLISKWVLGPQTTLPKTVLRLDNPLSLDNLSDVGTERFYGIARYNDVFPNSPMHITKFCFVMGYEENSSDGSKTPRFTPCSHWNCTDNECTEDKKQFDTEPGHWGP